MTILDNRNEAGKATSDSQGQVNLEIHPSYLNQNLDVQITSPRICIVGAGFSGLCAAIKLKSQLGLTSFTLFEERTDVGGTWLANTYPGCACDVESHFYSFSFEPNPSWSENFSSQKEIWEYAKNCAKKYELYPHIKFGTSVKSLTWNDANCKWNVLTVDAHRLEAHHQFEIVVNCPGCLRVPNLPEQFISYKGSMMHSAEWNSAIDLKDKIVAVIGSGASAVQIIPAIVANVKQLHIYQRSAPYVVPRVQSKYYNWTKYLFQYLPFILWLLRLCIFLHREGLYLAFKSGSIQNKLGTILAKRHLKNQVKDPIIRAKLTPQYKFGCKRVLLADDYYPVFKLPRVNLITSKIVGVNENSITTEDGSTNPVDVLILCTGFRAQEFFAPTKIYGRESCDILEEWVKDGPKTFYGTMCHNAPNFFMFLGPNTKLGHGSLIFMMECQANIMIRLIREMVHRKAKTVEVKQSSQDSCMTEMTDKMRSMIWMNGLCESWYANKNGNVTTLYPSSCTHFWFKTKFASLSNFEFK